MNASCGENAAHQRTGEHGAIAIERIADSVSPQTVPDRFFAVGGSEPDCARSSRLRDARAVELPAQLRDNGMTKRQVCLGIGVAAILASSVSNAFAAPARPSGAHPRIWLTGPTMSAMKSKLAEPKSSASSVVTGCDHILLPEKAG